MRTVAGGRPCNATIRGRRRVWSHSKDLIARLPVRADEVLAPILGHHNPPTARPLVPLHSWELATGLSISSNTTRHSRGQSPAAERSDGTIAGASRLLIGQAAPRDSDQGFPHFTGQFQQRRAHILMFHVCKLDWAGPQRFRVAAVDVLDPLSAA